TRAYPRNRSRRCARRSRPAARRRRSRRSTSIRTRRTPSTPTTVRATARQRRRTGGRRRWPGSRPTASDRTMADGTSMKTRSGLPSTGVVAGPADGALVLLLHGFPESRHSWRDALPALAAAGYRAIAPDQRGYSPGARPDPKDLSNYAFGKLVNDAIEIVAA